MLAILKQKAPLVVVCLWCVALLRARMWYSGDATYAFMAWNLWLAAIPVVATGVLRLVAGLDRTFVLRASLFAVWLAFLPNAPYLVTDLVHLRAIPPVPLWYDVVLLGSFAATGLLLAYTSVADIESLSSARFGRVFGSAVACGALALCGFGIYLGRFLRWNSWDLLASPMTLAAQVADRLADPMAHTRTWSVTVVYGAALVLGYLALKGVSLAPVEPAREPVSDRHAARRRVR